MINSQVSLDRVAVAVKSKMSSSPALEPSSPPAPHTTPSSPAIRTSDFGQFQTSTPNYIAKKAHAQPLNVALPSTAPSTPPTYGEPTLTPPPRSPGGPLSTASGDGRPHPPDGTSSDKSSETAVGSISRTPSTALSRKESYKAQRQHYRKEKKRVATALLHSIEDPSVIVLADWLKVRGSLKSWTKLWCVLKPGLLLLYKSPKVKSSHWVGTVLLTSCQVIERPSKKDGFCFKLYHPLEQSIWAPRGPHNETIGAVVQPLPTAHLIFRAPSQAAGHCWLDGLELALRCTNAMLRCSRARQEQSVTDAPSGQDHISHEELEKHFNEHVKTLSKVFVCNSPTPLMSVSDYSPKYVKTKPSPVKHAKRKVSKWANFVDTLEKMTKDFDLTSDTQTPDKDETRMVDKTFLGKLDLFDRNPPSTSAKISQANRSERSAFAKCFDLQLLQDRSQDDFSDVYAPILTKRRSSTPNTFKTAKNNKYRKSGVRTDSENEDKYGNICFDRSEVICKSPDNIVITKTAPSVERFRRYSSSSTDDVGELEKAFSRAPTYKLTQQIATPDKFSLINYANLPSSSLASILKERQGDRVSSQNVYVAGKIISTELAGAASDTDSDVSRRVMADSDHRAAAVLERIRTMYVEDPDTEVGAAGELVEEVAEENKSLLWFLLKQVRPGMDLSKVVLPTFILEPRSFLDRLADTYYHADVLAQASKLEDPYQRFKQVLTWYLSGLYKKPKGLKKPYNPVLGEIFRCCWKHDDNNYTYYVAEQVSHHPPVSAFYVSNRKEGFVIEGSLLARSKFYGNSTSAILEGCAKVHLLKCGETYITTAPYAYCKGIIIGTLSMELGGKVHIICPETGYQADIEFKLRTFLSGSDQTNAVSGRIKKGKDTIATIDGYWDGRIDIKDKRSGDQNTLVDVSQLKDHRLPRYLMTLDHQLEFESQRLWLKVSEAIADDDQVAATEQKTVIEEAQRARAKNLLSPWEPRYFHKDHNVSSAYDGIVDQGWIYNHINTNQWQSDELIEFEQDFEIKSLRGLRGDLPVVTSPREPPTVTSRVDRATDSDSRDDTQRRSKTTARTLKQSLLAIDATLREQTHAIERLSKTVDSISQAQRNASIRARVPSTTQYWDVFGGFILALILQALLNWLFYHKA